VLNIDSVTRGMKVLRDSMQYPPKPYVYSKSFIEAVDRLIARESMPKVAKCKGCLKKKTDCVCG
jgi:hypothetical protein